MQTEHMVKRPRLSPAREAEDEWEEHLSHKYNAKYWFNKRTQQSSWTDPRSTAAIAEVEGEQKQEQAQPSEDCPRRALRREQLRVQALHAFAEENSKYGEMRGNTKTARSCRAEGMVAGLQGMFARVLWSQKMRETLADHKPVLDPVFPSLVSEDRPVIKELVDGGRTEEEAKSVLLRLTSAFQAAAEEASELKADAQHSSSIAISLSANEHSTVRANDELVPRQLYTLRLDRAEYPLLGSHLTKLLRLYRQYTNPSATWEDPDFLRRVFCVVARYETLSSSSEGYQMAFPASGFRLLQELFGVEAECFASPLNVTLDKFCSVAYDTDRFFGSAGSFWKFPGRDPRWLSPDPEVLRGGGSYEANPPFVEEVMDEMAVRITTLLQAAESQNIPLSFCVIVPGWDDESCKSYRIMTTTEFARPARGFYLVLDRQKHNYRPGMQHRKPHEEQASGVNTFVFFLQTSAGAAKWPVTDDKLGRLKQQLEDESIKQSKKKQRKGR